MSAEKVVSFIIPAYNSEQYLIKCLDSFLCDEVLEHIEVIVINDGSADSTGKIGEEYHKCYPNVFSVIHKENGGHGSAINVGVKKAVGKYIKVVDSDDWVDTNTLPEYVQCLAAATADVVITPYYTVEINSGIETIHSIEAGLCGNVSSMECMVNQWSIMQNGFTFHGITYRRKFYLNWRHQLLEKVFYEDHEYATIPCCFAKTVLALNLTLYAYRLGDVNQSVNLANQVKRSSHLKEVIRRMEKYYLSQRSNLSEAGRNYFLYKLEAAINTYYKVLCLAEPVKSQGRHLAAFEDRILMRKLPELWRKNHHKYLIFLLMSYLWVSPTQYEKMLNSKVYKKIKEKSTIDKRKLT